MMSVLPMPSPGKWMQPGETVCLVLVDDEQRPGAQGWTRVWPNGVYQGIHSASKRIEWISASGTQQTDREEVRATMHGGGLSGGPRGRGPGRCKQDDPYRRREPNEAPSDWWIKTRRSERPYRFLMGNTERTRSFGWPTAHERNGHTLSNARESWRGIPDDGEPSAPRGTAGWRSGGQASLQRDVKLFQG
ncbi:hypothetical protein ACCO45_005987 [Purpureocillium lilacinum]|uniref:Uncharacterized protein n=1 Tax=Purpureocillium lilacinum TaxID=33203 RepID=A0ACC4DWY4_PURLI